MKLKLVCDKIGLVNLDIYTPKGSDIPTYSTEFEVKRFQYRTCEYDFVLEGEEVYQLLDDLDETMGAINYAAVVADGDCYTVKIYATGTDYEDCKYFVWAGSDESILETERREIVGQETIEFKSIKLDVDSSCTHIVKTTPAAGSGDMIMKYRVLHNGKCVGMYCTRVAEGQENGVIIFPHTTQIMGVTYD